MVLLQKTTNPMMIQKIRHTGSTLKQVKDVVTKGAGKADPMKKMKEEEELSSRRDHRRGRSFH